MSFPSLPRPRWLLSALLIAGAALFAIGVAAERHAIAHHTEPGSVAVSPAATTVKPTVTTAAAGGDADGGETSPAAAASGEGTTHTEAPGGEASGLSETTGETVLGLNLESNALVAIAVVISLALAALSWLRSRRSVLFAILGFALVFAVFDVAEVAHQVKESRTGLATLAAAIALVHVVTAIVAQRTATATSSWQRAAAGTQGGREA